MKQPIIICINSLRIGGTERVVSILLEHLKDVFEIHLALYNNAAHYPIPEGVKVFTLDQSPGETNFSMLMKGPLLSYRLYRYCRKYKIQTVVAFLNRPCYLAALMKELWNYKGKVVMCQRTHQSALVKYRSKINRFFSNSLLRCSFSRADLVLANSIEIEIDLRKYLPAKVAVKMIYNPLDLEEIERMSAEPFSKIFEPGIFHFIVLGGLRAEKNHSHLLKAFSLLKKGSAKLWIVGGGKLEEDLKAEAIELKLGNSVEFCGFINNPFPFVIKADCLVLASKVEGFPNALLEGLVCGKPVISTDCFSGPREILDPNKEALQHLKDVEFARFGILVPLESVQLLAKAMEVIMEDRTLREEYALRSREAIKMYDIANLKEEYVSAFSNESPC